MTHQTAILDPQGNPALVGHSKVRSDAETRQVIVVDGKIYTYNADLTNATQKTQIVDSSGNIASVQTGANTGVKGLRVFIGATDPISDLPVIMDFDHHQLHEGETFRWSVYTASLASAANKDIRLVVPNITVGAGVPVVRVVPHLRFQVIASDLAQVFLYEGTTFTGNGTQRTAIALERNGSYTSKLEVYEDPTVNAIGTMIWQGLLLGNKTSVGDLDNSDSEFALKNNTSYNLRVTSGTNGCKVLIRMIWYEDLGV